MRMVSIGEAMLELSGAGAPDLWRMGVAGDTLNTAWYARALLPAPWAVDYVTRLGQDPFSGKIADFIAQNGIGTAHIARDPARTAGLYAINLTGGERSFAYWRGQSAARHLADDLPALSSALDGARLAYLSAITLAILSPAGRENLAAALARARAQGCLVAFDTNYRPRLWEDAQTARAAVGAMLPLCDIILPSADDDAALFGDTHAEATALRYQAAGIPEGAVKNAGGPVYWWAQGQSGCCHDLPRAQPVDTTAAGDSFNGAYLAARLQGAPAATAIKRAHDVAISVIAVQGALVDMAQIKAQHAAPTTEVSAQTTA